MPNNLKEEILRLAKSETLFPNLGIRHIYEQAHSTTQIHTCLKSKCSPNEFMLNTLRNWSSFVYEEEYEFFEELEICKFIDISVERATAEYNSIITNLIDCEDLLQPPLKLDDFGKICRCILVSDKWNYRSIFIETEKLYIGCHWDTAE